MLELAQRIAKKLNNHQVKENFKTGDTIEVYNRVKEGSKERTQVFKGLVIKVQGSGTSRSFTVRKISDGVGVEKTFPFASPAVEKVKVIAYGSVRRSRLYYIRERKGKAARISFELAREEKKVKPANKTAETTQENAE